MPESHAFAASNPREVYREVHEAIGALIAENGQSTTLAKPAVDAGTGACFESPAEFDLIAHGRKIAGAALRRTKRGLLLQGSIQCLPGLDILSTQIASAFGKRVNDGELTHRQLASAQTLAAEKYATREWTMRV